MVRNTSGYINGGQEATPPGPYRPSGKVNLPRFIPLLIFGLIITGIMAFILVLLFEYGLCFYVVVPVLMSFPVLGAIYHIIRVGRCRNIYVGVITGLVLIVLFSGGYWELSYFSATDFFNPEYVEMIEEEGGAPGLAGYLHFISKGSAANTVSGDGPYVEPTKDQVILIKCFFALEFLIPLVLAVLIAYSMSSRVFYESHKIWATQVKYKHKSGYIGNIVDAIEEKDWYRLYTIHNQPVIEDKQSSSVSLKFEFLRQVEGQPVFISVTGFNMGQLGVTLSGSFLGRFVIRPIYKECIPAEETVELFRNFSDLLPPGAELPPEYQDGGEEETEDDTVTTEINDQKEDFRYNAAVASRNIMGRIGSFSQAADQGYSLCLPVKGKQEPLLSSVTFSGTRIRFFIVLWLIVFGAAFIYGTSMLIKTAIVLWLIITALSGIMLFIGILAALLSIRIIARMIHKSLMRRKGIILSIAPGTRSLPVCIGDPAAFHTKKVSVDDDAGLCYFDERNQRLLIEGALHEYIIRRDDIIELKPADWLNGFGAHVTFKIGNEKLSLIIAETLSIVDLLLLFPMIAFIKPSGRTDRRIRKALGLKM